MHGIMEGPGEELTVAAIATEGLDDGHHHLNGVSTALLDNGAPSPPPRPPSSKEAAKDSAGQTLPPQSPPAASTSGPSSPTVAAASPASASPVSSPVTSPVASPTRVASPVTSAAPAAASPSLSPVPSPKASSPSSPKEAASSAPESPVTSPEPSPVTADLPLSVASPSPAAGASPAGDPPAAVSAPSASAAVEDPTDPTVCDGAVVADDEASAATDKDSSDAASPLDGDSTASAEVTPSASEAADGYATEAAETAMPTKASGENPSRDSNPDENGSTLDINEDKDKTSNEQSESPETSVVALKDLNSNVAEDKEESVQDSADSPCDVDRIVNLSNGSEVSVKVEDDSLGTIGEPPCLDVGQKEMEVDIHPDEEASATSESETSVKDTASAGSEDFRMDVDLPSTDVKTEVIEDQEKSTDSGIVSEQSALKMPQKRSREDNLPSTQAKKQCLPDIVCGDANALDLSGMKKKDNTKEPKIALKPQSLLLSKLQGTSDLDKSKKDIYRNDDSALQSAESIIPSKASRRRSSRDEKDTRSSHHQRRGVDNNTSRVDQVLREMRTRVRSSYKEREKLAKEDSLLRDLLEPERDTLMTEFVDTATQGGGVTELDRVSAALEAEIRQLTVEINAKEAEWNDLIRKKKFKEELALRVQRRKQVLALTGDADDHLMRRNSFEDDLRFDAKRESNVDVRHERRHDLYREPPKTEELLAAALRLGSRNVEDYHHRSNSSSPLAVRIQARANELLIGSTPTVERKSSGPPPGLSHMQTPSLLQSQLTKPTEMSPSSPQSQFLLQHLQRQRVGAVSSAGLACRQLSSSVSLSALPTSTSTSSALNASLPSTAVHKNLSRVEKQVSAASASRMQRPILPKPSTACTATSGGHVVSDSSQDGSGKGVGIIGEGRQGAIIDVQSIIADYRSQHPENVPRRGRRMKSSGMVSDSIMASARPGSSSGGGLLMSLPALGSGSHVRTGSGNSLHSNAPVDLSELGFVLSSGAGSDGPSRPSSTESSLSGAPSQVNQESGMSFKDVLVQFAKMTNANEQSALNTQAGLPGRPPPPPYPEVTLHPVVNQTPVASPVPAASNPPTSLLHNILTKPNNQSSNNGSQSHAKPTTFSPTLARLLTAPERSSSVAHHSTHHSTPLLPQYQPSAVSNYAATGSVLLSDLLSVRPSKKARSELTITPVSASAPTSSSSPPSTKRKNEVVVLDADVNGDEGDASDPDERRLVIDEGDNIENGDDTDGRSDRSKNTVPHCQGCNERDAEFVCAGCQRQWYCSRECQIAAWDEHSEQCFPASNDN